MAYQRPVAEAIDTEDLHLIVEGKARRVREEATLRRASAAFRAIYDWPTVVTGGQLDSECGAPTPGGSPYAVFEIIPTKAFGLPTGGESLTPTRWRLPLTSGGARNRQGRRRWHRLGLALAGCPIPDASRLRKPASAISVVWRRRERPLAVGSRG
jgi:hypothetical protein